MGGRAVAGPQFQGPQDIIPGRLMSFELEGGNVTFKLMLKSMTTVTGVGGIQPVLPLWELIPLIIRDGALFQVLLLSIFSRIFKATGTHWERSTDLQVSPKVKGDSG